MRLHSKFVVFVVVVVASTAAAQTSNSRYDPTPGGHAVQRKSFVESTLSRINPQDSDYGQHIEEVRRIAIESTLDNYYFWSNAVATVVSVMLFVFLLYQLKLRRHMIFSTAEVVTSYHNQLAVAEAQLSKVSTRYAKLRTEMEQEKEPALTLKAPSSRPQRAASGDGKEPARDPMPTTEKQLRDDNTKLKQQLGSANETITSLRQQVSTLSRRLEEEQQKNRRLSGA